MSYDETLNLPGTGFPMRAGLPEREPAMLKTWQDSDLYGLLMKKNEGRPLYILHDGPPYANGKIHLGTALNKTLKDFVIKYKNMTGYKAPYVPGYDTHGLPTELKARKAAGMAASGAEKSPLELRGICRDFALRFCEDQRRQFERLGVLGDWEHPYRTLSNDYVARQIEVFGEMARKGYIYQGLKPVYWCPECRTALAEAEIEYGEDRCHSIYVKFEVADDKGKFTALGADLSKTWFVIWTTTTWTLPANLAICLGPEYEYGLYAADGEYYVMAVALAQQSFAAAEIADYRLLGTFKGSELEYLTVKHPFIDRESLVIVGDHVTLESGTGCVHTAPGHGIEDFEVCRKYPQIGMVVPIDAEGNMTEEAGIFAGLSTEEANKQIALHLEKTGHLFALKIIRHQYPHCWRCKSQVIFRATKQWFCSVKSFAGKAADEIRGVEWVPGWGAGRITGMVTDRSDWCISRQRVWGVPIPIFYCRKCGKAILTEQTVARIAGLFREYGADVWYSKTAAELLPEGFVCPDCGGTDFAKENDIMDVWFDSGVSHTAVLDSREGLRSPADLYLEGADQYRGWFQSSLLTSVAIGRGAPYKTVVTHGWVVDGEGKKMSKSLGNTILPEDIVEKYGADILRLWVASSDYHADIRVSDGILKQLSEVYRKIRNTARFMLGNISDFNPNTDSVPDGELEEIDRYALCRMNDVIRGCRDAYEHFEYHMVFHILRNFCIVDLSNFYLDVIKDRLYVEKADSRTRRAAQTAVYRILRSLTLLMAPVLSFTAEEIWGYMPRLDGDDGRFAVLNDMPEPETVADEAFLGRWNRITAIRGDVTAALETARAGKTIGSSLEAEVVLRANDETRVFLESIEPMLPAVMIVSAVKIESAEEGEDTGENGVSVKVLRSHGGKCARCWNYSDTVGKDPDYPDVCSRCAAILKS